MVALGLALVLGACATDDMESDGTMIARINGNEWRATTVTAMRMGTTLSVGGKGREPYSLAIVASGATGPGTYPVTDDLFAPRGADFALLDATTFVTTALNGSGSLTITSLSPVEAAGSFSFTAGQGSLVRQVSGDFTVAF